MTGAHVTGVNEIAVIGSGDVLEATIRQQGDRFICKIRWPKSYDSTFMEITSRIQHQTDPDPDDGLTRMTLQLPAHIRSVEAADAWLREHYEIATKLLPEWILHTPSGEELCMRTTIDEPVVCIKNLRDAWDENGWEKLAPFTDALNRSPLCQTGTVEYVGRNVEVYLSPAALELKELEYLVQLAELYV